MPESRQQPGGPSVGPARRRARPGGRGTAVAARMAGTLAPPALHQRPSSAGRPAALAVAGRQHPGARLAVHEVRAHRGGALGVGGDRSGPRRRGGAAPGPRSTTAERATLRITVSSVCAGWRGWRSGSGTARGCRARPARRRGWWGSRRRRRRTRARRSAPARTATAPCTTPRPPRRRVAARRARAAEHHPPPGAAVDRGDAQAAVEPRRRLLHLRAQLGERVRRPGERRAAAAPARSGAARGGDARAPAARTWRWRPARPDPARRAAATAATASPRAGGPASPSSSSVPTDEGRRGRVPATR